jgi:hypothetical protein
MPKTTHSVTPSDIYFVSLPHKQPSTPLDRLISLNFTHNRFVVTSSSSHLTTSPLKVFHVWDERLCFFWRSFFSHKFKISISSFSSRKSRHRCHSCFIFVSSRLGTVPCINSSWYVIIFSHKHDFIVRKELNKEGKK